MKIYKKLAFSTLLISAATVFNSTAFAGCSSTRCVGAIERLYINSAGNLFIASDGDETSLDCTAQNGVYMTLPASDPNFDRKYALLLTAYSLGQDVGIRIVNGSSNCAVSYFWIDKP